jgi:hypothetical protein
LAVAKQGTRLLLGSAAIGTVKWIDSIDLDLKKLEIKYSGRIET